jgi:uncharacterized membrane protein YjjP (DUF1212 family)
MSANAWSRFRSWGRTPPVMERTVGDDLKVAGATMVGVALACLVGLGSWTVLIAAFAGILLMTVALNLVRHFRRE